MDKRYQLISAKVAFAFLGTNSRLRINNHAADRMTERGLGTTKFAEMKRIATVLESPQMADVVTHHAQHIVDAVHNNECVNGFEPISKVPTVALYFANTGIFTIIEIRKPNTKGGPCKAQNEFVVSTWMVHNEVCGPVWVSNKDFCVLVNKDGLVVGPNDKFKVRQANKGGPRKWGRRL